MYLHPFLSFCAALVGVVLLVNVLWEGFETIVLPRSITRTLRFARVFYRVFWKLTSGIARRAEVGGRRELFLSYFGPLSLPLLLGLWASLLVFGFALIIWSLGPAAYSPASREDNFGRCLYSSGVTFFTLGYGDIVPRTGLARGLAVLEAGVGFGFLGLVIGYLPVLYQAFSRREATISRLDGRGGSPPSAGEMLRRHAQADCMNALIVLLAEWEVWSSEILESHLSYPVLPYYRSQHDRQSWLGALTSIMDICVLLITGVQGEPEWLNPLRWQARMTFAMARHTVIDLAYIFNATPTAPVQDRLPAAQVALLRQTLRDAGLLLNDDAEADSMLTELRRLYEPYVYSLAEFFLFTLPPWQGDPAAQDNWQTSAWDSMINLQQELKHFH